MVGRVFALPLLILVVDRAAVANPCEAVEHHHLAGSLDERRIGDDVRWVFQHGKIDAGLAHVPGDVLLGLVRVGINAEQHDSLLAELTIELDQPGSVQVSHRAVVSQEYEHNRLTALKPVEGRAPTRRHVTESEIRQSLHQAPIDRQLEARFWLFGPSHGNRRQCENKNGEQRNNHQAM